MIEHRRLKRNEVNRLIKEAPESETKNLKRYLKGITWDAYDFFDNFGIENDGIVIDGRPIYLAVVTKNSNKEHELWTLVNSNVSAQFTLYKISKREVHKWLKKYKAIYATMEKSNPKNLAWTRRLGFKQISEDSDSITFRLNGGFKEKI